MWDLCFNEGLDDGSVAVTGSKRGKVWLIGAGPGDVELLTVKAIRALGQADVALVDDLVTEKVLQFLHPAARILKMGKRGGHHSSSQAFIQKQMVRYARQGLTVARVKGGDPFVFGRGGEEVQALQAAGIDVEVANGITAGIGVPAAAGIPVTHRDFSHGVTLITGHTRGGEPPNWHALAHSGTTLVIYMGIGNLAEIAGGLCAAGMPASTPVAVVQDGTLPSQRCVVTTIGTVVDAAAQARIASPAVIVVGEVARFAAVTKIAAPVRQVA